MGSIAVSGRAHLHHRAHRGRGRDRFGEDEEDRVFPAADRHDAIRRFFTPIVLEVKNFGLLVELPDVLLTGLIHISSLTDDFYTFERAQAA